MKFLRRNTDRHSKLGRKRKKKQIWRKPKGRHNKMRDKKRGYPALVSAGYRKSKKICGKLNGMNSVIIRNVNDFEKIKKGEIGIVGSVGMKNKINIVKKAKEKGTVLYNINIDKFIKKNTKPEKKPEENKK